MAIIIGKNHEVITYYMNGRKQYIVERTDADRVNDKVVADVKRAYPEVGNKWEDVYNKVDQVGLMTPALEKAIDRLTY